MAGYTPVGGEFRRSQPGGWPQVTAHHRLLDRFAAQIPPDAPLSVTTDLYPHLDHRELVYQFPILGDAQWALVDVSGTTDQHPVDIQTAIRKMMAAGWGVVDAADGYLLLAQGRGAAEIPDSFYDFARISASDAGQASAAQPQYPLDVMFGDKLRLIGYDIIDNAKWRRTNFRFYWEALEPLPADTAINMQVVKPDGEAVDDTALAADAGAGVVSAGELAARRDDHDHQHAVVSPRAWAPVLAVTAGARALAPRVTPPTPESEHDRPALAAVDGRLQLPAWERRNTRLRPFESPSDPRAEAAAHFAGDDWQVGLTHWAAPIAVAPGDKLSVSTHWRAANPASTDYNMFVHLRDESGRTVATGDGRAELVCAASDFAMDRWRRRRLDNARRRSTGRSGIRAI